MTEPTLSVLLVDNEPTAAEDVRQGLARVGVATDIDYQCPIYREQPFGGCTLPRDRQWNDVDLALIDLELFAQLEFVHYSPEDLRGGTEVLPYLRAQAPWIVAIAYSRLFRNDAASFLPIACGFGFDGHTTRGMFRDTFFSRGLWDGILERARLLRKRALLGHAFSPAACNGIVMDVARDLRDELQAGTRDWQSVVREIFYFGRKIVIERAAPGYSGAKVLRAYVAQAAEDGNGEGEWIVKLSNDPWKLHREAEAHLRMVRGGLEFARGVQLLWPGVVAVGRGAGIAYQFARGTQPAIEYLDHGTRLQKFLERIEELLRSFYRNRSRDRGILGQLVRAWSPPADRWAPFLPTLSATGRGRALAVLAQGKDEDELGSVVSYQRCLIHGDLHLGNIMIGDANVLIDFARSDVGPVAADLAKAGADLLLRVPELRGKALPLSGTQEPLMQALDRTMRALGFTPGDNSIFDVLIQVHLLRSLEFPDVQDAAKDWVRAVIGQ